MSDIPQLSSLYFNSGYDAGNSLLSYTSIYGNGTEISFNEVQALVDKNVTEGIMFGVRCGAACLTLLAVWMTSQSKKTPIFIMNQCSLILIMIHSAFYFRYLLSGYSSLTYALTGFPQVISRNDTHIYAAASLFQVLLVASIETSLVFQVKVIFTGHNMKGLSHLLLTFSAMLATSTVAMYLVTAIKGIILYYTGSGDASDRYFNVSTILLASSINFMTCILVIKLVLAIKARRYLGLKQFDTFHILLIMSFQTLLVPSIIFILAYSLNSNQGTDKLIVIGTLLVVISLPLSSMWAGSANNSSKPTSFSTASLQSSRTYQDDIQPSLYSETTSTLRTKITGKIQNILKNPYDKYSEHTCFDLEKKTSSSISKSESPVTFQAGLMFKTSAIELDLQSANSNIDPYTPTTTGDEEARTFWCRKSLDRGSLNRNTAEPNELPKHIKVNEEENSESVNEYMESKRITLHK